MELSLEQAIGQKCMTSFEGTELPPAVAALLASTHLGGICLYRGQNVANPAQVRALTTALQRAAAASGQPPLLIAADQEGGQLQAIAGLTAFPGNMALGATGSPALARACGEAIGRELAAVGINVNFAPVADVTALPGGPAIGTRSFGTDPQLAASLASALIVGMQAAGVAATAKHFPGHGAAMGDSHHELPLVDRPRGELEQLDLPPFRAAIAAGVRMMMTAHIAYPELDDATLPATLSSRILRGLLRDELGFGGLVISDALNMNAIGQGDLLVVEAIAAIRAGVDVLLLDNESPAQQGRRAALVQAARRGLLDHADLRASARRVLELKAWLAAQPQPALDVVGGAHHRHLARQIAASAITLVRDDAGCLPLAPMQRVLVVTPQPADLTPADTSSYEQIGLAGELRRHLPSVDELVVPHAPTGADIAGVCARASSYDLVVVGTLNAGTQPAQAGLVRALLDLDLPVVVAALRMPDDLAAFPAAPTYVCAYSIQQPALAALADALVGKAPFGGRLPMPITGLYPPGHHHACAHPPRPATPQLAGAQAW